MRTRREKTAALYTAGREKTAALYAGRAGKGKQKKQGDKRGTGKTGGRPTGGKEPPTAFPAGHAKAAARSGGGCHSGRSAPDLFLFFLPAL